MSADEETRVAIILPFGEMMVGDVQGSGGLLRGPSRIARLEQARAMARLMEPHGLYEPAPGCIKLFDKNTARSVSILNVEFRTVNEFTFGAQAELSHPELCQRVRQLEFIVAHLLACNTRPSPELKRINRVFVEDPIRWEGLKPIFADDE
jgi:hypothetical protein